MKRWRQARQGCWGGYRSPRLLLRIPFLLQRLFEPVHGTILFTVEALGVGLQKGLDAVAGPLSNLRRLHPSVEPGGHGGVA